MKPLTVSLALGIVLAMSFAISATEQPEQVLTKLETYETQMADDSNVPAEDNNNDNYDDNDDDDDSNASMSLRGFGRFLGSKKKKKAPKPLTCDKNPKVCRAKGSTKKDCCKKKCVSKATDRQNCGKCGRKCKFSQSCCKGKCVNTMSDKNNCGACGRKCKKGKGRKCHYGMCNYAYY
uniref:Stigma-specific STIG1-like protein 1 n=1 Tax=Kalanchoe fedtschenkoi TaxID=63787 RepID=A0A7N0RF59_KALFE